ncbi:MAG: hypothetical protein JSS42_04900 [Proteobacteria bacterium]|nr:hypothetical protein [Pseudomonadota bacterium]
MKIELMLAVILASVASLAVSPIRAAATTLEPMPAPLETRFALAAVPPALRDQATVYLLDPGKGYHLSRQGTNGIACLVERTVWEWADLRDDVYVPLCYDTAGAKTYLKVIIDAAALRAQGMDAAALKAEVEKRYKNGTYKPPTKPGLSYMVAPLMRALGPPDMRLHTMAMPHLMFYAPGVSNEDIGAKPNLADHASLAYPFIDKQGNAEQSYFIQLVGETEKAKILADEKSLIDDLCAYRNVLCLAHEKH